MASQSTGSAAAGERFDVLQSCRGLLAVAVVVYHLTAATHFYAFVHGAYAAVDFFFVLSGFVIAAAYEERVRGVGRFVQYAVRRVGRLYPLHLFVLGVWLLIEFAKSWLGEPAFQGDTSWPDFWQNLFLTQAFGPDSITWNYPAWSIGLELWANVAAGLILLALGRRWWIGAIAMITLLAAFYASQYVIDYAGAQARFDILANDSDYIAGFFIGMLVHSVYRGARRVGFTAPWGMDVLGLAGVLAIFRYADAMPFLSKSAAFAIVVLVIAFERGPVSALLRRPAALWLGTISYSIYLTHVIFVNVATEGLYALGEAWGQAVTAPIYGENVIIIGGPWLADAAALSVVAVTLGASALTYRFVEDPARRWFNRISSGVRR